MTMVQFSQIRPHDGHLYRLFKGFAEAKGAIDGRNRPACGEIQRAPSELFHAAASGWRQNAAREVLQLPLKACPAVLYPRRTATLPPAPISQRSETPGTTMRGLRVRVSGSRPIPARPVRVRRFFKVGTTRRLSTAPPPPAAFPSKSAASYLRRRCWTYPPQP